MFVTTRDQGRWRRSHSYGVSKAARSSKLSLLSAVTTSSRGSNDSASTITQESYTKSSSRTATMQRRPARASRSAAARKKKEPEQGVADAPVIAKIDATAAPVDVFAFLVEEEDTYAASTAGLDTDRDQRPSTLVEPDSETLSQGHHSDSGISLGSSTLGVEPEHLLMDGLPRAMSPIDDQRSPEMLVPHPPHWIADEATLVQRTWPSGPSPPHHRDVPARVAGMAAVAERQPSPGPDRPSGDDNPAPCPGPTVSGYDLVADELSQRRLPPVFRQFRKTNFRVLLQLQDEIVELEEILARLDQADSNLRRADDGSVSPASRRSHPHWRMSELDEHRSQILGHLYIKLEQYYQALLSGQRVRGASSPAASDDIARFQAWLQEHRPLATPESRFLDDSGDLMSLDRITPPQPLAHNNATLVNLCSMTTMLLALLFFKAIPGVLDRLILLTLLTTALVATLERNRPATVQHHSPWLVSCFGMSCAAAIFL